MIEELFDTPYLFEFVQSVRLLELHSGGKRMIGQTADPRLDPVRFRASPSLGFPATTVESLTESNGGSARPPEMVVTFMGLTGPSGALPQYYTNLVIERIRKRDTTLRDFLDLFNHRFVSLFYLASLKYHAAAQYERAKLKDGTASDPFSTVLFALIGLRDARTRGRLGIADEALLYCAAYQTRQPQSAASLQAALSEYFDVDVEVHQFQGQWLTLDTEDRMAFPSSSDPLGRNNALGQTAVVGSKVWDVQSKFRLRLGPLSYGRFCQFIRGGSDLAALQQFTRLLVGPEFAFDIQPVLRGNEVPRCELGIEKTPVPGMLGRNIWLSSPSPKGRRDAEDVIFPMTEI